MYFPIWREEVWAAPESDHSEIIADNRVTQRKRPSSPRLAGISTAAGTISSPSRLSNLR